MSDRLNIPALSSQVPAELRNAFDAVRDYFNANYGNDYITKAQLRTAGLIDQNGNQVGYGFTPPKPIGFTATGLFAGIMLEWDQPAFQYLAYTQIHRATVDDLGQATIVAAPPYPHTKYTDTPPNASLSVTYYYWIRHVSIRNVIGPYNDTNGTPATTANDPDYMLEVLTGELTESQLHGDLTSRIDLIDTPTSGLVDRMIAAEAGIQTALAAGISTEAFDTGNTYNVGALVSYENSIYKCIQDINSPPAPLPTDGDYWLLIGNYATIADMVSATAAGLETLDSRVDAAESDITAQAADILALETTVNNPTTGVSATSSALSLLTSRVTDTENSQGSAITALQSTVDNPTTGVAATASALSTLTTRVTNVEGVNTTQAGAITTLQTTVGNHTTSIQTNASSIDGIQGKYTVKIDNNGYVTGYGLISTLNTGTPTSEFAIVADKFSIAPVATNGDANDGSPFFHLTTTTTVGGVSLPAGTYMKKAFITDLTSTNIRAASITSDRLLVTYLSSISSDLGTITAGDIWAARFDTSSTHTGKRFDINYTNAGEMTFYGDRGDGTIEILATIGIQSNGGDYVVGKFGSGNQGSTRVALWAESWNQDAISGVTRGAGTGVSGSGTNYGTGVFGSSENGIGVSAWSTNGYGIFAYCPSTIKSPLCIQIATTSTAPAHAAQAGSFWVTGGGSLYYRNGSGWQLLKA